MPQNPPSSPPTGRHPTAPPPGAAGSSARSRTVEVVDDDQPLGSVLSEGLEARGYRSFYAADAATALQTARDRMPDLILCDIDMPGKNGHRLLQDFRSDPDLADCQFVFMTGNTAYAKPRVGMDLGADDFLLKPFTLDDLVSCVAARLDRAALHQHHDERVAARLRTCLGATLPHEFFTPLTGIMGLTDLLEEQAGTLAPEDLRQVLHNLRRSSRRLYRTLRNYLYLLSLDDPPGGGWTPEPLAAPAVVEAILEGARTAAGRHERANDLVTELEPARIAITAAELSLIAEELADNAFAFSSTGSRVRVGAHPDGGDYRLEVEDAGRGMSPQQLREVGAFHQFERARFEQQGLGAGLALVRRMVARNGGSSRIESVPGRGTIVHVRLPLAR